MAYMLKYDSVHGPLPVSVEGAAGLLTIGGDRRVKTFAEKDPAAIDWASAGVDVVVEATGAFTTLAKASGHLHAGEAGPARVVITAPSADARCCGCAMSAVSSAN